MIEDSLFFEVQESGERIDALLVQICDELTRNSAQRLIESGLVEVNGKTVKKNYRVNTGDGIEFSLPEPEITDLVPENIPLDIVYEDNDVIVVNKARGMVVHPAPGHPSGTLVNALMFHCGKTLSGIGGELRPGIVHRIDKDTSGLIIAAKNDFAHRSLTSQLSDHTLHREYAAVVNGHFRETSGTVDRPIGRHPVERKKMAVTDKNSRNAVTHWELLAEYKDYSLVKCILETGRTHQIRVHMASLGHSLLGDGLYGAKCPDKGLEGQCLHAKRLCFIHPVSGEKIRLECDYPEYFLNVLSRLGPEIK